MKKIEIIPIAKRKAYRRNIPVHWIIGTINSPMEVVEGYGGRQVAHRKYIIGDKEYLLRVVFEKKKHVYLVITAYLTSHIKRYWKGEKDEDRI